MPPRRSNGACGLLATGRPGRTIPRGRWCMAPLAVLGRYSAQGHCKLRVLKSIKKLLLVFWQWQMSKSKSVLLKAFPHKASLYGSRIGTFMATSAPRHVTGRSRIGLMSIMRIRSQTCSVAQHSGSADNSRRDTPCCTLKPPAFRCPAPTFTNCHATARYRTCCMAFCLEVGVECFEISVCSACVVCVTRFRRTRQVHQ